eukprot:3402028-Rhodomonas_salina.1
MWFLGIDLAAWQKTDLALRHWRVVEEIHHFLVAAQPMSIPHIGYQQAYLRVGHRRTRLSISLPDTAYHRPYLRQVVPDIAHTKHRSTCQTASRYRTSRSAAYLPLQNFAKDHVIGVELRGGGRRDQKLKLPSSLHRRQQACRRERVREEEEEEGGWRGRRRGKTRRGSKSTRKRRRCWQWWQR